MGELDDVLCLGCFSRVKGMERMVCKFDLIASDRGTLGIVAYVGELWWMMKGEC